MQVPKISSELENVLQQIANDVVNRLGCMGAMVSTIEQGNLLIIRAHQLSETLEELSNKFFPDETEALGRGMVFKLRDPQFHNNLVVQAVLKNEDFPLSPITSDFLYDLFSPYLSLNDANELQKAACIAQVIVVPFQLQGEMVGCLMVAASAHFTQRDIEFLNAFGQQAATSIQSQRRLDTMQSLEQIILQLQVHMSNEKDVLQEIVDAVVAELGYAGAIVATLEKNNALPVRAYAIDESAQMIFQLEEQAGVSLLGDQAVVYLDDDEFKDNLSVRAIRGLNGRSESCLLSYHLYDLLRPVVNQELADEMQNVIGIQCVAAVPFFLGDKVLGNLFVISRKPRFSKWELSVLTALGQQAAIGINNARLFRETIEQRQIAQTFGRMAFSTVSSAHSLRNYVGNINGFVQLLQMFPQLSPEHQQFILDEVPTVVDQLDKIITILNNLNKPWEYKSDEPVDVHSCLIRAMTEIYPRTSITTNTKKVKTETGVILYLQFAKHLPAVETARDMLSEAFRIIIKNAEEAMSTSDKPFELWISTKRLSESEIELVVRDTGSGISKEDLDSIFDLGWSTKKSGGGMGFGLFWAKDYIDGLGGNIKAFSRLGEGTTFRITLPLMTPEPLST
ncbi:MAG: hypothetical protein CSB13_09280 [Chloroflexi bacterium]|nr:MAG: hypothetical protein CSB13_09280 [Chloroflexota bacterium]